MKRFIIILLACCALVITGCKKKSGQPVETPDSVAPTLDYTKKENIVKLYRMTDSLNRIGKADFAKMQLFIDHATTYAQKNENDTISPHFLLYSGIFQMQLAFSKSDLSTQKELAFKAIDQFNHLLKQYPKYKNAPYCYFYKGQIYENLNRLSDAENEYRELIHLYPDSELGKSTAEYLNMQGFKKSPDQLWEEVSKKQPKGKQ